jgi:arginase
MFPNFERLKPTTDDVHVGKLKNAKYVSKVCQSVHELVKDSCQAGNMTLTLGGDHSLGMGTVSGSCAVYPNIGVIWVDAHAVLF